MKGPGKKGTSWVHSLGGKHAIEPHRSDGFGARGVARGGLLGPWGPLVAPLFEAGEYVPDDARANSSDGWCTGGFRIEDSALFCSRSAETSGK